MAGEGVVDAALGLVENPGSVVIRGVDKEALPLPDQ
jgi:hypothetical protein